ncbi:MULTISPECIES: phage holin family protein [Herbiconiux]|jgi:putative membrane protein|uniref:Putative membrane protein n=1 Tax=Herbiconiux flava TaxID=881268 RepID=A0A852SIG8_9MICO|nr:MULTISPECIES: phage holin family protein [Herbiconiux]NQX34857.1 phage holin family protein [Herbiconiux sp. VKM Ac-2851]NYD69574.1 putative membrane protein [Herbiconiux flava]GLK16319.1 membrane protein [Herbiconiux flava]
MRRFLVSLVVNAIALWLTTLIVAGVKIDPIGDGGTVELIVSYLLVALVFGIVNGIIGSIIRVVAFPLYILTLGIISFFVNALLLWLTSVFTGLFGFGLTLAGFWWTVLGALVLAILSAIIGAILRPLAGRRDRR